MRSLLTALLLLLGAMTPTSATPEQEAVRLMLVGDSITHGSAGDFTWRYFLHQHLEADDGVDVDLVGPADDLWDWRSERSGSHDYADPDFDRDHASRWGNALVWPQLPIRSTAEAYEPDVVVLALGTNDLGPLEQSPAATWTRVREEVVELRRADPAVRVVLVEVMSTQVPGASDYNGLLAEGAAALSATGAPVVVARAAQGFVPSGPDREGDTWDRLHPDTSGQVRIAAAVADALARIGVGAPYPRPLQIPPDGLRRAPVLAAVPSTQGAVLTWQSPPGATGVDVWLRDASAATPWGLVAQDVPGSAILVPDLTSGHDYEIRVRARKIFIPAASDMASNTVTVRVPGPAPAPPPPAPVVAPALPSGVQDVRVEGRRGRLLVTWREVPQATSYLVWWSPRGAGSWRTRSVPGARTVLRDLPAGGRFSVRLQAVNEAGAGPSSSIRHAVVRGRRPARVSDLRLIRLRNGDLGVRWDRAARASGYELQHRSAGRPGWRALPGDRVLRSTRLRLPELGPGPRVVRVRAWNDQLPGRWSKTRSRRAP